MAGLLRLEVREFRDLTRWRWVLTDASGAFVADHEVRLNPDDWQFEAFADLPGTCAGTSAPDRRRRTRHGSSARSASGSGRRCSGRSAPRCCAGGPQRCGSWCRRGAGRCCSGRWSWRTWAASRSSVQDVTLVMEAGADGSGSTPVGERLRVLGLFSLPEGGQPLNLRRERHALVRLIRGSPRPGRPPTCGCCSTG